jgi:uracil-DNA glycosylase
MKGDETTTLASTAEPPRDCQRCARLAAFRTENCEKEPGWFNGPVPSFGNPSAQLLIVGLAPGLKGANRTGRPFTGDHAGILLYETLVEFGFAKGQYDARPDDGLQLSNCMISNAVRCVPPQNKPTPAEIAFCRPFLAARIGSLAKLKIIVALGRIAHESTLTALGLRKAHFPFAHRAAHEVSPGLVLIDSLHCSRLNTNTRRLTPEMFRSVFADVRGRLGSEARRSRR